MVNRGVRGHIILSENCEIALKIGAKIHGVEVEFVQRGQILAILREGNISPKPTGARGDKKERNVT